ncbi:hypothetical protein GOB57_09585 [Sinorhizobium meliloti]|nr:hypothetical protein [Sinorhizobium meliloti]
MRAYARLTILFAALFTADAALSQMEEAREVHAEASDEVEAPSHAERCWPSRNVGIAETSQDYYAFCRQTKTDDTIPQ